MASIAQLDGLPHAEVDRLPTRSERAGRLTLTGGEAFVTYPDDGGRGSSLIDLLDYNVDEHVTTGLLKGLELLTIVADSVVGRESFLQALLQWVERQSLCFERGADREDWNDRSFGSHELEIASEYAHGDLEWRSWEGRAR